MPTSRGPDRSTPQPPQPLFCGHHQHTTAAPPPPAAQQQRLVHAGWRGRVKRSALNDVPAKVARTSMQLAEAVAADYWGVDTIQYNENGELDLLTSKLVKNTIVMIYSTT